MMFQPFSFLRPPFTLLLSVFAILLMVEGHAQLPVSIQYPRSAQNNATLIHVRWQPQDELNWLTAYEDRMDKMGLKTDIQSSDLSSSQSTEFRFYFNEGASSQIACLVNVEELGTNETLQLVNASTHEVIVDFNTSLRSRLLTPDFDPAQTVLIWTFNEHGARTSRFSIDNIFYAKHDSRVLDIGFGTSLACHPNVICKTDSMDVLMANAALRIRIVTEEGTGYCTGAMINNTRNDKTPYLITSYHCQWNATPLYDQWRFDFNYVSPTCPNPAVEPAIFSLTGCELISSGQGSDFLLVRLDDQVPDNMKVTFAGWNRDDVNTPDTTFHVHHPKADIRKFSTSTIKSVIHPNAINWSEGYSTPANHHIHFEFTEGGHEPGSSGGPVFDQDGFFIGQLHGGTGGCAAASNTFVGRFSKSWNFGSTPDTRLRDWLDPDNTGVMTLPHLENVSLSDLINIEGTILDPKDRACGNVKVLITGSNTSETYTDAQGHFTFAAIDRHGEYQITPEKNTAPVNGLNVLDVLAIQKHSLAKDTFDFPWQHIAADVTNNNSVTVGDIVQIMRLLLGKIASFPTAPSWRFDPPLITLSGLPEGQPAQVSFTAIKMGDVNATADPSQ